MQHKKVSALIGILLAGSAIAGVTQAAPTPEGVMQRAATFYRNGDLASATAVLQQGIAEYPKSAQLQFMLGHAYFREGKFTLAAKQYEKSATLRPNHPDTYLDLGFAYFRAGSTDRAVAAWRDAVRQSPNDSLPRASLAIGLQAQGDLEVARKVMGQAMSMDREWRRRAAVDIRWTPQMVRDADRLMTSNNRAGIDDRHGAP